jgi:F0F1-type ATP synthase assembly protein I
MQEMELADQDSQRKRNAGMASQISMAMELPLTLIVGVLIGGGAGYFLDRKLHTGPVFLLVGGILGFAGSMIDIVKKLSRGEKGDGSGGG